MAFRKPFLVCSEVVEKVTDFMESALSSREWALFKIHLAHCADCRAYLTQMRGTVETCRLLGSEDAPKTTLPPRLKEHFGAFQATRLKHKKS